MISPDKEETLTTYLSNHHMTFRAIADPGGAILQAFGQESSWWRFGRMPALLGFDTHGQVIYRHMGQSMKDFPDFDQLLTLLSHPSPG